MTRRNLFLIRLFRLRKQVFSRYDEPSVEVDTLLVRVSLLLNEHSLTLHAAQRG